MDYLSAELFNVIFYYLDNKNLRSFSIIDKRTNIIFKEYIIVDNKFSIVERIIMKQMFAQLQKSSKIFLSNLVPRDIFLLRKLCHSNYVMDKPLYPHLDFNLIDDYVTNKRKIKKKITFSSFEELDIKIKITKTDYGYSIINSIKNIGTCPIFFRIFLTGKFLRTLRPNSIRYFNGHERIICLDSSIQVSTFWSHFLFSKMPKKIIQRNDIIKCDIKNAEDFFDLKRKFIDDEIFQPFKDTSSSIDDVCNKMFFDKKIIHHLYEKISSVEQFNNLNYFELEYALHDRTFFCTKYFNFPRDFYHLKFQKR